MITKSSEYRKESRIKKHQPNKIDFKERLSNFVIK